MKKRLLSLAIILLMIGSFMSGLPNNSIIQVEAAGLSLNEVKAKFPQGAYWNHVANNYNQLADILCSKWDNSTADSITWSPCQTHNGQPYYGNCDCNVFEGSMQCNGFAKKISYDIYGSICTSWGTTSYNNSKPGDVIHYYASDTDQNYGHWAMIIAKNGNVMTFGECNVGKNCAIRWDRTVNIYSINSYTIYSAPHELRIDSTPEGSEMTSGAGKTIPDGNYVILSELNKNLYLDISGTEYPASNSAKLNTWEGHPGKDSKYDTWTVTYLNNGYYKITQNGTNMCLDVQGGSRKRGTSVISFAYNNQSNQQWSISATAHGYKIQSRSTGYYLDVYGANTNKGTPIQIWENNDTKAQFWGFVPYASDDRPIKDGEYRIKSSCGDVWLDASGDFYLAKYQNGANVQVWTSKTDSFVVKYVSDGYYKIYEKTSGLALDVNNPDGNYLNTKKNIQLYDGTDMSNRNQLWRIISVGNGQYTLISKLNGYCLDLYTGDPSKGQNVQVYPFNSTNAQKWYFEIVECSSHEYGVWSTTKEATCTEDGVQTRKCSACGKTETKTIAKKGHKYTTKIIAPTTATQGYTLHTCSVCGDSYKDNYKPKLDAPKFTTQPQNATVSKAGDIAAFTVSATGTGLKYAWFYRDGTSAWKKTSVTTNKYSVVVTEARHGRQMYCEATDKFGVTVKSNVVTMRIGETANITSQPKNATVGKAGDVASFTIAAEGADLKYAWFYRDGSSAWKKTSVTTNKYSVVVTEARNGRQMYCEVTNKYGNIINSNVVTMKIADAPKFTSQPKSVTVGKAGDIAAFTVSATGTGLKYAWFYRDGTSDWKKTSVTTNKYSVVVTEARHGRQMYCEATDKFGVTVKSNVVTMRIGETANITSQPKSVTVGKAGDIASFTIAAEGTGLKYAWFYRDGTSAWKKTSVTTNKYSVVVTEARNNRQMYCEVTNKYGNITKSNVVTMKIGK